MMQKIFIAPLENFIDFRLTKMICCLLPAARVWQDTRVWGLWHESVATFA